MLIVIIVIIIIIILAIYNVVMIEKYNNIQPK